MPGETFQGRGAGYNPPNRFEKELVAPEPPDGWVDPDEDSMVQVQTRIYRDDTQGILSWNDSPDIPFRVGINPYRGCEHGCAYCYARPSHEFLGFSAGLDFETKILVKERAPELLEAELRKKGWEPQVIALSGNTDCYQPLEKHFQLTRRCLEVLARFRNPVGLITKNHLVTRDLELLGELARHDAVTVGISITTLDRELARRLEPRASTPRSRLAAVRALADAGVPVHVMVAPLIPGLNDDEVAPILAAASDAGARSASYTLLRLPLAVEPLFSDWLERNQPTLKETVLARLRGHRDGVLYRATPGTRMRGSGPQAEALAQLFGMLKRRHGLDKPIGGRSVAAFRVPPADGQLTFAW